MTTPADTERRLAEVERRARQQGDDITALYELVQDVDRKVTVLDTKVDAGFATMSERLTGHDRRFDSLDAKLDAILSRLSDQG